MAEIIDLDFYRKFRIILPIRPDALRQEIILKKEKTCESGHHTKRFRRKKKGDIDHKVTKNE
jgi:hypothetical protein